MANLDPVDQKILQLLRVNARISHADLAREVGRSPSACLRRIKRLEQEKILRGYTAIVETASSTRPITVIVSITLDRQTEDHLDRFEAAVRKSPDIRECYLMTGGSDYLLHVQVDDAGQFERIHRDVLARLPGVQRINSSFAIRDVLVAGAHRRSGK
jgi:DNA-binding Lrp family transcriptional regulator